MKSYLIKIITVQILAFFSVQVLFAADSSQISINFAGDVTFANHFERYVGTKYHYPFAQFSEFAEADISVVNLENPLTRRGIPSTKQFNFRALPEYVRVLQQGGIDIVNLANNHTYDYSDQGLFDTIYYLDEAGIRHIGAGKNIQDAHQPVVITVKGVRIGFLAYYGLRKHSDSHPATADSAGTALRKLKYIREDIRVLREKADCIIVNFHWGIEKEHYPEEDQIWFAHKTIDYGADLIIGHHPHVLQGIESYKDKFIVYSLGNFIFGGNSRKHETSAVFQAVIDTDTKTIADFKMIPIEINYWQPRILTGSRKKMVQDSLFKYSSIFQKNAFQTIPEIDLHLKKP